MEVILKQRMVGIAVFVAILAIFPLLFYHPLPGGRRASLSVHRPAASAQPPDVYDFILAQQPGTSQRFPTRCCETSAASESAFQNSPRDFAANQLSLSSDAKRDQLDL